MIINSTVQLENVKRFSQKDYEGGFRVGCFDALQPLALTFWARCVCTAVFFLILPFENTYGSTYTIDFGVTNTADLSSYTGGVTVNGTYNVNGVNSLTLKNVTGSGTITNTASTSRTLTLNSATGTTFSGAINDSYPGSGNNYKLNIAKSGAGTLTLSGTNTYAGTTSISAGTLLITGSKTGTGATSFTAGTLQIGDGGTTGSIAGTINTNNGTLVFNRSDDYTHAGTISGSGIVTKNWSGTLTLAPTTITSASLSGSATINLNAGTLKASSTNTNNGALGTGQLNFNGGILEAGNDITLRGSTNLLANGTVDVNNYIITYTQNPISGSYGLSIINNAGGSGTVTMSGAGYLNTYTGPTTIGSGVTVKGSIATSVGVTVTGIYDLNGAALGLIDPSGSGTIQSSTSNAELTVTSTNGSTFSGTLDSTISGLTKNGSGTFILSGTNSMASGTTTTTTISAGTLQIGAGSTTGSIASNTVSNSGVLIFNRSDDYNYAGSISGTGSLTHNGQSTLTISNATYAGSTTISSGATLIGNIATSVDVAVTGTYDLNGTARTLIDPSSSGTIQSSGSHVVLTITSTNGSTFSGTLDSSISGLNKSGPGTLTLSGTNNYYSGSTTVNSGTLALALSTAAGSRTISLSSGTTLNGNFSDSTTLANLIAITGSATLFATQLFTTTGVISGSGSLIIDGGTDGSTAGRSITFAQTAANTYAGSTTLQGGASLSISSANHLSSTTAVIMGNNTSITVTTGGFSLPPLVL